MNRIGVDSRQYRNRIGITILIVRHRFPVGVPRQPSVPRERDEALASRVEPVARGSCLTAMGATLPPTVLEVLERLLTAGASSSTHVEFLRCQPRRAPQPLTQRPKGAPLGRLT